MGLAFRNNSQRFKKPVGFPTTNVRTGLYGEYVFGGTQADSVVNTAGITDLALFSGNTGAVDYTSGHAVVKSNATVAGFSTGINNTTDDFTLIQVAKSSAFCIGCDHDASGPSNYWAMTGSGGGEIMAWGGDYYNSASISSSGIVLSDYHFGAFRSPRTGQGSLMRYSGGSLQQVAVGNAGRSGREIKIGGLSPAANYSVGSSSIAYTAIFTRALSDAEIATVYANLKAYLTNYRGLTVS